MHPTFIDMVPALCTLARQGGDLAFQMRNPDAEKPIDVAYKKDGTEVTKADQAVEALIMDGLRRSPEPFCRVPILSEEAFAESEGSDADPGVGWCWVVDPIDGTRGYARGQSDFTVNIALLWNGFPVFGVIDAPAWQGEGLGCVGWQHEEAGQAWCWRGRDEGMLRAISVRAKPADGLCLLVSKRNSDEATVNRLLAGQKVAEKREVASSIKFGLIALGEADFYPRLGPTSAWDIAAGQAVLEGAGGRVCTLNGSRLRYQRVPGFINPSFYATS